MLDKSVEKYGIFVEKDCAGGKKMREITVGTYVKVQKEMVRWLWEKEKGKLANKSEIVKKEE